MKFIKQLIFSTTSIFFLSSCNMNTTISSLNSAPNDEDPLPVLDKFTSIETVIGSSNYQMTAISGYKVKQSAGLLINKQLMTTSQGFRVFTHINGRITSQELDE